MAADSPTDPEATADLVEDLRLRATPRHREARNPFAAGPIVEHWRCRGGCGTPIGVTADDVERLAIANARLHSLCEEQIAKDKVMWCPRCKRLHDDLLAAQRRPHRQLDLETGEELGTGEARALAARTNFTKPRRSIR